MSHRYFKTLIRERASWWIAGSLLLAFLNSCTKGQKSVEQAKLGTNFIAIAQEFPFNFPPNAAIEEPIKFTVTNKDGRPIPRVKTQFKAFVITKAIAAGLSDEKIASAIFYNWDSERYTLDEAGEINAETCTAGTYREVCAGLLSGGSAETNMNGEATVGLQTANNPSAVIAVAMLVPSDSTAANLIQFAKVKIASLDEFAKSGRDPIEASLIVIPPLFDNAGRRVIKAGSMFNIALYANGIPSTDFGKGYPFEYSTENVNDVIDGVAVNVPSGSEKCDFYNNQCIIPGGPFRVMKPTTIKVTVKPVDPKFPVKAATIDVPVVTGEAKGLVLSLTPSNVGVNNACVDPLDITRPCFELSADQDAVDIYPVLVDDGGNFVATSQTTWTATGPLASGLTAATVQNKQTLLPYGAGRGTITVRADQFSGISTTVTYVVRSGAPASLSARSEHSTTTASEEQATVPFKAKIKLYDRKDNLCVDYVGTAGIKLKLDTTYAAAPPPGLTATSTLVDTIDHMTSLIDLTGGEATTTGTFNVVKVPDGTQLRPKILVDQSTLGLTTKSPTLIDILPGPATQTLFRNATGGAGDIWNSLTLANSAVGGVTPPPDVELNADQQYFFYVAGYDAGGNYVADINSRMWGVNYRIDDADPAGSGLTAMITDLATQNPSAYKDAGLCPAPATIPDVTTLTDQSTQPHNLFCGVHRGLAIVQGNSTVYKSVGTPGSGRVLAIPLDPTIKYALSPVITTTGGMATKFSFEFVDATTNTVITPPITAGRLFKINVHAQDPNGIDSLTYTGLRTFDTVSTAAQSWGGIVPNLPNGQVTCTFNSGVCQLPGTYYVTDNRVSASITIEQVEAGGVSGPWSKLVAAAAGPEAYLVFASKRGGHATGATVRNPDVVPVGYDMTADDELAFGIAVTDSAGNYLRDASVTTDGLVFEGFYNPTGDLTGIFNSALWGTNPWQSTYTVANMFVENLTPSDSLPATPKKFYDPANGAESSTISAGNRNATLYTTVMVPQNRIGKGYAVVRSAVNTALKGWPSPWIKMRAGTIEHAEYIMSDPNNPAVNNSNVLAGTCNQVRVLLHDKKHNQLTDYNAVVDTAIKFFRTDATHPNGFDDPHAGDMSFINSIRTCTATSGCTSPLPDYYAATNRPELGMPRQASLFVPNVYSSYGGSTASFLATSGGQSAVTDWWAGNLPVLAGEIQLPGSVCLASATTLANYNSGSPTDKALMQIDLPPITVDGVSFAGLTTRGAGVQYIGQSGATVGSTATAHALPDQFTVKRGAIHHLHGTLTDALTWSGETVWNDGIRSFGFAIGVEDGCSRLYDPLEPSSGNTYTCGPTTVYWHTHDESHNFIKPASTSGFTFVASTVPSGQIAVGTPGALGSASIQILANNSQRLVFSTGSTYVSSISKVQNTDAQGGLEGSTFAGQAADFSVQRSGDSTLNTDNPFGFIIKLIDQYGNVTGTEGNGITGSRTLKFYWSATPSNAPDGTSVPKLVGSTGVHNSLGTAVAKTYSSWPDRDFGVVISDTLATEQSLLVAAGITSTLNIRYINNLTGQTLSKAVNLYPFAGEPTNLVITSQPNSTGTQYKTANYSAIFNTNPGAGAVYPLVPDINREIDVFACAQDVRQNIGNCTDASDFSFSSSTPSNAIVTPTGYSLTGVTNAKFYPKFSGTAVISASRVVNGVTLTGASDPITINPAVLDSFRVVDSVSSLNQSIAAGTEMSATICMMDRAYNVLTSVNSTISVSFTNGGIMANSESNSIRLSKASGAGFAGQEFGFGSVNLTFTSGCTTIYAIPLSAAAYNDISLIYLAYADPSQGNKIIRGEGLTVGTVAPLTLDHFVTELSYSAMATSPMAYSTHSWVDPTATNVAASSAGNRFPVTIRARDIYGNEVTAPGGTTVTLSLVDTGGNDVGSYLKCTAPTNDTSCLSASIAGQAYVTVSNLAIQIGGRQFYIKATDGSATTSYNFSNALYGISSRKTVNNYTVGFNAAVTAGVSENVTITAIDLAGSTLMNADADLGSLAFTFIDGSGNSIATNHIAPDGSAPVLPSSTLSFSAGVSTNTLILTKAESGLALNIKDNQSPVKQSSNATASTVAAGTSLKYGISCAKTTGGADCTGSSGTPYSILASVTDKFNLTIQAYDQYKNVRGGEFLVPLKVNYVSGTATLKGDIQQYPYANSRDSNSQILVNASSSGGVTASNLFYPVGNQTLSINIDPASSTNTGMLAQPYFTMQPSIDMVYRYAFNGYSSFLTAGTAEIFTIEARDFANNIATGIDAALNAQTYTWSGASNAPDGSAPIYPSSTLTFTNGVTANQSITLKARESVFITFMDNYVTPVVTVGGSCISDRRCAQPSAIVSPALASSYAITATTTTPYAGSAFDVTVAPKDQYSNTILTWASDTLTFAWTSGGSSSVSNPKTAAVLNSAVLGSGARSFTSGLYSTTGTPFVLYRSNTSATSPQETSQLTVTGTATVGTLGATPLTGTLNFTTQPAVTPGYVKMTTSGTYSPASSISGQAFAMTADQTKNIFAHTFDAYGNYKGNGYSVGWSGSSVLSGKFDVTSGNVAVLSPITPGTGVVSADCTGLDAGCVGDSSGTVTVSAGAMNKLVFISPTPANNFSQDTETCQELKLQAQDQNNNAVTMVANLSVLFTSTGGNGEFYASSGECTTAQAGANGTTPLTGTSSGQFHYSTLSGSAGSRSVNISSGNHSVSVWYANRTAVASNGVTITAQSSSWSATRNATITSGPSKRFSYNTTTPSTTAATCAAVTFTFRDKWDNLTTTTASSTINHTTTGGGTAAFYSDSGCTSTIAGGTQSVSSGVSSATLYYKNTQANSDTLTLLTSSTLSGYNALQARTATMTVNPGSFALTSTPFASGSKVKDTVTVNWTASTGARDYTVSYGTTTACTTTHTTTASTTANIPSSLNNTYYICVRANGYSGTSPGLPQVGATSNASFNLIIDNTNPTAAISAPSGGTTYIGPVTAAMGSGATTVFSGTAADSLSGVSSVEVQLVNGSNYWNGSSWTTTATWLVPTGTTSWSYTVNDSVFDAVGDNSNYTFNVRVTDQSGNVASSAATKAFTWLNSAGTVTAVSSGTANGSYKAGQAVSVTVTFNKAQTVTGTPQITLETGATDAVVNYSSGSGTSTLTFTYTIGAGHNSADLDYVSTTALSLNGGTIKDLAENPVTTITLATPGAAGSLSANKDIKVDTTVPTVTGVTSSTGDGTKKIGDAVSIQVSFSENVNVTNTPTLALNSGGTASYSSGSGTSTLTFTYTVASGNSSADLDYSATSSLALSGGTINDIAANAATLTLPAVGGASSLGGTKAIAIDGIRATVSSVSSSTANATYKSGGVIAIDVTFSEAVTVTGTPQLTLETGASDAVVNYSSGSGTTVLTFNYTVGAGQNSSDLDYQSTTALALNGGTINDAAGNTSTLTLASPGAANSLGNAKAIVIDTTSPTVSSVSSGTANGSYKAGQVIAVTVTFSEAVTVASGTPQLTLETGTTDAVVNYSSGSGTTVLTFNYTIGSGETSADLDYQSTTALALNGATIQDAVGNNATLTLASPGAANSLGNAKAIVVDTTTPTLAFASGLPSAQSKSTTLNVAISTTDTTTYKYAVIAGDNTGCAGATLSGNVAVATNITNSISGLADGQVTICAQATDLAGNAQTTFTSYTWTKDTTAPALFSFTGPSSPTSSTTPTITWSAPAGDVNAIELIISKTSGCGSNVIESYKLSGGTYSALAGNAVSQAVAATLTDGTVYLCAYVYDVALNQSSVITGSFELETNTVHISWSADNAIYYGNKAQTAAWTTETVDSGAGTYNGRTSLALSSSANAYVSYSVDDSTNTYLRYRNRTGVNTWAAASDVNSAANATVTGVGSFNELAIYSASTVVSAFFGYDATNSGLLVGQNTTAGSALITEASAGNVKDMAVAIGTSDSRYAVMSQLSASNYILKIVNKGTGLTGTVTLPTNCVSAPYVSAFAKGSDTVIGMAIACVMSNDNTCHVQYGEATYTGSGANFTYSAWTDVGTIKAATCTNANLSANDRPSLVYDRQNSNKVSIAWRDQVNNQIKRWTNESGSNATETVLTGGSTVGAPTIALDATGKSYIVYGDGNNVKYITNNARAFGSYTGGWSTPVTISSPTTLNGIGNVGITGMKGRGNFTGGQ